MASTLFASTAFGKALPVALAKKINYLGMTADPFLRQMVRTRDGVVKAPINIQNNMGLDFKIIKTWREGVAGARRFQSPIRTGESYYENADNVNYQTNYHSMLSPYAGTGQQVFRSEIPMAYMDGNVTGNLEMAQISALPTSVGDLMAEMIDGNAEGIVNDMLVSIYRNKVSTNDYGQYYTVSSIYTSNGYPAAAATKVAIRVANGRVWRAPVGTRVSITDAAGAYIGNTAVDAKPSGTNTDVIVIDQVDMLNQVVTLRRLSGNLDLSNAANLAAGFYIHLFQSKGYYPYGIESYAVATATGASISPMNINLDPNASDFHPNWASSIQTVSGTLTRTMLYQYFNTFNNFYKRLPGVQITKGLTTAGVMQALLAAQEGGIVYTMDGTGKFDINTFGGAEVDEVLVPYGGRNIPVMISENVNQGYFYGLNMANGNWKCYQPPPAPGYRKLMLSSQSDPENPTTPDLINVYWLNPLMNQDFFQPVLDVSTGAQTTAKQAPYFSWYQFAPDKPQALILKGLDELPTAVT